MAQAKMYDARMTPNQMKQDKAQHGYKEFDQAGKEGDPQIKVDDYWLLIARDAYNESESYYDANIRNSHERNMSHFQNRHAPGSKYYSDAYKYRHKGFRPKTRSMVRRQEAALAKSMFSTSDFVTVKAARSNHPAHQISAEINQKLLQYRLENTIPWFATVIGAYQETLNLGLCVSHQYWDFDEEQPNKDADEIEREGIGPEQTGVAPGEGYTSPKDEQEEVITGDATNEDSNTGSQALEVQVGQDIAEIDSVIDVEFEEAGEIFTDTPACELRPAENVFFSVAADWRDPANSSPFIIDKIPMFLDDVKAMAKPKRGGATTPWYPLTESQLLTGVTTDYDPVRRQRESNREDSKDQRHLHRGFDTVWVHRNIIRKDGIDWIYYTLGVHYRLSEPIPLREDPDYKWLKPKERPYIIGFSNLEAHKNYPESLVGLTARTQQDANQLNNTRFDNVELSLNRRYVVKRSAMIDYRGLQRNVPGGVTETDDPQNDIKFEQPPDVTSSSYQEQDRINADFDELAGMFSGSSMSTNRSMNETVGGMKLMAGDADALTEYPMMIFMITWVIPVLKQIIRLEQTYESDPALLNLMGETLGLWQRFHMNADTITDAWIQGSMNLQVAANFGASNPEQRMQRLAAGFGIIFQVAPAMAQRLAGDEFTKEILGAMGYQGTERFFPEGGPKQGGTPPPDQEGSVTEQDQAKLDQDAKIAQAELELKAEELEFKIKSHYDSLEEKAQERLLKKEISQQQFDEKMTRITTDRQNKVDEMRVKLQKGSGI